MIRLSFLSLSMLASTLFLAGCSIHSNPGVSQAVEAYLRALVNRDLAAMVTASCSSWEAQARIEYDSFTAVKLNLESLDCTETGPADAVRLVSCQGRIIANYGAEDLEIDIADRTFQVISEGGDWRMCGYAGN